MKRPKKELQDMCVDYGFDCTERKWYEAMTKQRRTKEYIAKRLAEALRIGHASKTDPLGVCFKSRYCHLPNSECGQATCAKKSCKEHKHCMCKTGYCYRLSQDGTSSCEKPDGTNRTEAFAALNNWIDKAELRIGLYANQLKMYNAGKV